MLQTVWDSSQQVIRILLYIGSGWLVGAGIVDQATGTALAGAVLALLNALWTFYWNRKVVTVGGLDAAGATNAAAVVETVLDKVKADKKRK